MFWPDDRRQEFEQADREFVEILVAYRQEEARRAQLGEPAMKDRPRVLAIAERRLKRLQDERRVAFARPRQIAVTCRYTGAGLLIAFVLLSLRTRLAGRLPAGQPQAAPVDSQ
ncbi:MAG: hypothetical protein KDA37_08430 [Planctomycetales bacterium]|nr:hypothetical protein [Planctomycetales bacterium]